jgi:glutamate-1-semialdehyde aminotransferase
MVLAFKDNDDERITLMRTLMQQELVKKGVITYKGFMLPSYAHDDKALAQTLAAFEHAIAVLVRAVKDDAFARYLEIPLVA